MRPAEFSKLPSHPLSTFRTHARINRLVDPATGIRRFLKFPWRSARVRLPDQLMQAPRQRLVLRR